MIKDEAFFKKPKSYHIFYYSIDSTGTVIYILSLFAPTFSKNYIVTDYVR
uniref:Uncharacterized protein n=1 Tax=Kuenenia stuttgartiensis TaxID=174633 RepID=Q1Q3V4_KUEST|nr:unknown protein [Candidatus Kuenenia stuttgartiensis]